MARGVRSFRGVIAEGRLGSEKVLLLKPETFMNLSGQSVGEAMRFYKLEPADVVVFHDELDLAPGKVRVKQGGGHAGHNGLRSLHGHIGPDYTRVRLGIGHPGHKDRVSGYVLSDFARAEADWLEDVLHGVSDGAAELGQGRQWPVHERCGPSGEPAAASGKTGSTGQGGDRLKRRKSQPRHPTPARPCRNWWTGSGEPA